MFTAGNRAGSLQIIQPAANVFIVQDQLQGVALGGLINLGTTKLQPDAEKIGLAPVLEPLLHRRRDMVVFF